MSVNDEGVYEVLLSGRQLLGVTSVVLLLMTVAFWIGQLTAKQSAAVASSRSSSPRPTLPVLLEQERALSATAASAVAKDAAMPAAPFMSASSASARPEARETASGTASTAAPATETAAVANELKGTYLQLVAGGQAESRSLERKLAQHSFHALCVPSPKAGIFRVLVGPLEGATAIAQTRDELTKSGFNGQNAIVRKL